MNKAKTALIFLIISIIFWAVCLIFMCFRDSIENWLQYVALGACILGAFFATMAVLINEYARVEKENKDKEEK